MKTTYQQLQSWAEDVIVKAAVVDLRVKNAPPKGFIPVPGSKHGGYFRKVGTKTEYWYPDLKSAWGTVHEAVKSAPQAGAAAAVNYAPATHTHGGWCHARPFLPKTYSYLASRMAEAKTTPDEMHALGQELRKEVNTLVASYGMTPNRHTGDPKNFHQTTELVVIKLPKNVYGSFEPNSGRINLSSSQLSQPKFSPPATAGAADISAANVPSSLHTVLHEVIHSCSKSQEGENILSMYSGPGALLEEATTEMATLYILKRAFNADVEGTYGKYRAVLKAAVADTVGGIKDATKTASEAAIRMRMEQTVAQPANLDSVTKHLWRFADAIRKDDGSRITPTEMSAILNKLAASYK